VTVSHVANPTANAAEVLEAARLCHERSVAIAVFPELCLSGYAIEDLLMQQSLLEAVEQALESVVEASANWMTSWWSAVRCVIERGSITVPQSFTVGACLALFRKLIFRLIVNSTRRVTLDPAGASRTPKSASEI
jgi:hypothetical protein